MFKWNPFIIDFFINYFCHRPVPEKISIPAQRVEKSEGEVVFLKESVKLKENFWRGRPFTKNWTMGGVSFTGTSGTCKEMQVDWSELLTVDWTVPPVLVLKSPGLHAPSKNMIFSAKEKKKRKKCRGIAHS